MALYHCRQKRFLIRLIPSIAMFGVIAFCLLDKASVIAQDDRELMRDKVASMQREKRLALVIGNGRYSKAAQLDNPVNDANDVASALSKLGFEVLKGTDANLVQMRRLIREFGERLDVQKGVGLFYYAGHGVEVRGRNYRIPVDADIAREVETEDFAIDVSAVLRQMDAANNGFNIVILDACRNNPFARAWNRNNDVGGLANVIAPTGTFIAFASAPGSTAADGRGRRNGIFTGVLLKYLEHPNLKLEDVFKFTRQEVMSITGNKQVPWDTSSVKGEFFFNYVSPSSDQAAAAAGGTVLIAPKSATQREQEAWDLVKGTNDAETLRIFISEFPEGKYTASAKIKLDETVWLDARRSNDKVKIEAYLRDFPNGANISSARILLRQIEAREEQQRQAAVAGTKQNPPARQRPNPTQGAQPRPTPRPEPTSVAKAEPTPAPIPEPPATIAPGTV